MTRTATALSSQAARVCWCWKSWKWPRRVARKFMAKSPAMARHPTAMTWSPHRAKARRAACARRWQQSRRTVGYINPHATSTPVGDRQEIAAIREVFGADIPPIAATKSLTGHSLGATGVQEAIYSLLMMNNGFICESANISEIDPDFADLPIVRKRMDNQMLDTVLSNSFGFGGTNATLVFQRLTARLQRRLHVRHHGRVSAASSWASPTIIRLPGASPRNWPRMAPSWHSPIKATRLASVSHRWPGKLAQTF